jgi:hypothetical protein
MNDQGILQSHFKRARLPLDGRDEVCAEVFTKRDPQHDLGSLRMDAHLLGNQGDDDKFQAMHRQRNEWGGIFCPPFRLTNHDSFDSIPQDDHAPALPP